MLVGHMIFWYQNITALVYLISSKYIYIKFLVKHVYPCHFGVIYKSFLQLSTIQHKTSFASNFIWPSITVVSFKSCYKNKLQNLLYYHKDYIICLNSLANISIFFTIQLIRYSSSPKQG